MAASSPRCVAVSRSASAAASRGIAESGAGGGVACLRALGSASDAHPAETDARTTQRMSRVSTLDTVVATSSGHSERGVVDVAVVAALHEGGEPLQRVVHVDEARVERRHA